MNLSETKFKLYLVNSSDNHERRLLSGIVVENPPVNTGDAKEAGGSLGWEDPLE